MTGELTLSGRILPIGEVKEKLLAARRAGVKTVILPYQNHDHLTKIEDEILNELQVELVDSIDQIIDLTLLPG